MARTRGCDWRLPMGCAASSSSRADSETPKGNVSVASTGRVAATYIDVPLSQSSRPVISEDTFQLVAVSWEEVCCEISKIGKSAFLNLWELHPNARQFFSFYRDLEYSEVETGKALRDHGIMVIATVGQCIRHFKKDLNWIEDRLKMVGQRHTTRGVRQKDVDVLVPLIIDCMGRILRSAGQWNSTIEDAWYEFFTFLTHIMKENMGKPPEASAESATVTAPAEPQMQTA